MSEMVRQTNAQVINLQGCIQGRLVMIVLTKVGANCDLEFLHAGDETWEKHPDFDGTHADGVVLQTVRCPSPYMRLNFASAPGDYHLSVVHENIQAD
jgi:hypothetical protein